MKTTVPNNHSDASARADANRRNAQHATGPRTEAGQARSSQNAVRSGWFARDLRVTDGQVQLYLEFEEAWLDELAPQGLLELEAFSDFLRAAWHKREVIDARNRFTASFAAALLDGEAARQLDRLHRYQRDFERRANQALRELRRLQTERALRAQLPDETAAAASPRAAARSLPHGDRNQPPECVVPRP